MATIRTSLGQQDGEWKAAIGDLQKKAAQERSEVSGLKEVLGNLEGKHEKLQETVARQGEEVAETMRRNSELGRRVQQLEEENRLHRESSAGLKGQLARVEAGRQSEVARLQETITAGGSKVKEGLLNVQGELAKMKEEIRRLEMTTGKPFPPSVKKGKCRFDVPDGIIAHLTGQERARPPLGLLRAPDEENRGRWFIVSISLRHYTSQDRIERKPRLGSSFQRDGSKRSWVNGRGR
jgi:hypothetical protein